MPAYMGRTPLPSRFEGPPRSRVRPARLPREEGEVLQGRAQARDHPVDRAAAPQAAEARVQGAQSGATSSVRASTADEREWRRGVRVKRDLRWGPDGPKIVGRRSEERRVGKE